MLDHRVEALTTTEGSATEPFNTQELDERSGINHVGHEPTPSPQYELSLDELILEESHYKQGIRILLRSHENLAGFKAIAPSDQSIREIELWDSDREHKVLAVCQTSRDTKVSVTTSQSSRPCELYYDPSSDKVIFYNKSDVPVELQEILPASARGATPSTPIIIKPIFTGSLGPGVWRLSIRGTPMLDFRILEKVSYMAFPSRRSTLTSEASLLSSPETITSSAKRGLSPEEDEKRVRRRLSDVTDASPSVPDGGVVVFVRPDGVTDLEGRQLAAKTSHALLDAETGETVQVTGIREEDSYMLSKLDPIANTPMSAVYQAQHSDVPDNIIAVKVLKTKPYANSGDRMAAVERHAHERNIIRQADSWDRETKSMAKSQEDPSNGSIVKFHGGDARFLSIFMEYVAGGADLTANRWRSRSTDMFIGSRTDALRVLRDISSALAHIHARELVHNDIKPGNILYSPERGAVLCDFGLSTPLTNSPTGGGTPYYLPPEFIGDKRRGPPSDVWALGVTMLYLLRKIPFPDGRGRRNHARPLYWQIAGVNNPNARERGGNGQPAVDQMRQWLMEIREARARLGRGGAQGDVVEMVVSDMLVPQPSKRITMQGIVHALSSLPKEAFGDE